MRNHTNFLYGRNIVKHVLIDGNNLLYRYYYVRRHMTDPRGNTVSGVLGVLESLNTYSKIFGDSRVYLIWDGDRCEERLRLYPEYKKNRETMPQNDDKPDIMRQREVVRKIVDHLPVPQILVPGTEADDIIGMLCRELTGEKIIVSSDRDFFQLVSDSTSFYLLSKDQMINNDNIDQVLGFPRSGYVLWKAMVGDKSDNIKGIHGIGPVKAAKAIKEKTIKQEWLDVIRLNKQLISIGFIRPEQRVEVKKQMRTCLSRPANFEKILSYFREFDFKVLSQSIDQWGQPFAS
jgi:DNA polymerase-1